MENKLILGGKSPESYLKVLMRLFGTKSKIKVIYTEKRKVFPAEEFFQLVESGGFFVSGEKIKDESYLKFTYKMGAEENGKAQVAEYFPKDDPKDDKLRIVRTDGTIRVVGECYENFSRDELKKICEEQGTKIACKNIRFYSREIYKK
ncbi:MAG: hypothetical protein HY376_03090 [Candidatus Blackburnbacteria bacterium]|nr:hypothetical protein [Candidatus Blackburnbacteria bacterium]